MTTMGINMVNVIDDFNDLKGKTIKHVAYMSIDEISTLIFFFEDGDVSFIQCDHEYEDGDQFIDMFLKKEDFLTDKERHASGIISDEEFRERLARNKELKLKAEEERDKKEFIRLIDKYFPGELEKMITKDI